MSRVVVVSEMERGLDEKAVTCRYVDQRLLEVLLKSRERRLQREVLCALSVAEAQLF